MNLFSKPGARRGFSGSALVGLELGAPLDTSHRGDILTQCIGILPPFAIQGEKSSRFHALDADTIHRASLSARGETVWA